MCADKAKKTHWTLARRIVQCFFLVLFCLPPLLVGWGLAGFFAGGDEPVATPAEGLLFGTLSSSEIVGVPLFDPLAALEVLVASHSLETTMLLGAVIIVVFYALVRGRAFCGWVCPVNLLGEIVDGLRRKMGLKVSESAVNRHVKIGVALAVVVLSAIVGFPVFETISPIGSISKGLAVGGFAGAGTLLAIVIAELFFSRRVWCRSLCPLGGLYECLGKTALLNVHYDFEACIHCGRCQKACLCDPVILEPSLKGGDPLVRAGDCMACGKCVDVCPTHALVLTFGRVSEQASVKQEMKAETTS